MTLPTSQMTTVGRLTALGAGSALLGFEARVGLVDDVDPALAAHELAVAVTRLQRLERASDLHGPKSSIGPQAAGWRTRARAYTERARPSQPEAASPPPTRDLGFRHARAPHPL